MLEQEAITRGHDGYAMTFTEIGELMGLTKQRVEQIYKSALKKLEKNRSINRTLRELHFQGYGDLSNMTNKGQG